MKECTGLLDRNLEKIYDGDYIRAGMRRGDPNGWTVEKVVRRRSKFQGLFRKETWSEWCLVDRHGSKMDMVLDQELREKVK